MLPVITVPLNVPVLNAKSFRIAPALRDHVDAHLVRIAPDSAEAQRVVAQLVRARHGHADDLKESLRDEGQSDPGVITRSGVLINANTRCVLMRELLEEGQLRETVMRVAVLPSDVGAAELLDLEAVLQKRRDHKDDYDLVSELMMLSTLHEEGQMTAPQIAKRQRIDVPGVNLRFKVLALMERARLLVDPPLPIQEFGGKKTQLQNWKELVTRIEVLDADKGKEAGDDHLREFLQLHLLGMGAVHTLRVAQPGWVDGHLVGALGRSNALGGKISSTATSTSNAPGIGPVDIVPSMDDGLELLDFGSSEDPGSPSVKAIVDLTMKARNAGVGDVELPDGSTAPAASVLETLANSTRSALKDSKALIDAGERLEKPARLLADARRLLEQAGTALADVIDDPDFSGTIPSVLEVIEDIHALTDELRETAEQGEPGAEG